VARAGGATGAEGRGLGGFVMRELSLFSGAGGGLLGTKLLGWECIGAVEINEWCCKILDARQRDGLLPPSMTVCNMDVRSITKTTVDTLASLWYHSEKILEDIEMAAPRKEYNEAVRLYDVGLSIADVAAFYEITRQAMHLILKRRGVVFRANLKQGNENHFYRGGSIADDHCQNILEHALSKGIIERKTHCEKCLNAGVFEDGRTAIQGHHCDYNKPLDVLWLCQKCHHEWHKSNNAIPKLKKERKEASDVIDVISAGFP
jgi:hypothetical protein